MDRAEIIFIVVNFIFGLINVAAYYASKVYANTAENVRSDLIEQRLQLEKDQAVFKELVAENTKILQEIESKYAEPRQALPTIIIGPTIQSTEEWIKEQREIFGKMSYDDFADWLDKGTVEELRDAAPYFEMANLPRHAEALKAYLKNKGVV